MAALRPGVTDDALEEGAAWGGDWEGAEGWGEVGWGEQPTLDGWPDEPANVDSGEEEVEVESVY